MTSGAVLIQFSNGYIEVHFYYFIILVIIAMYEDWIPYVLAVCFVIVQHGLGSQVYPDVVYNNQFAISYPWLWALALAGFISLEGVALVAFWNMRGSSTTFTGPPAPMSSST